MYAHMCMRGRFVCSPFTTEISKKVYPAMGFRKIEAATHRNYDGRTETYTYEMDTRDGKLREFLASLFRKAGLEWREDESRRNASLLEPCTSREREVIAHVISGCSNAEIAAKLFVSEATVKKHLKSIYVKLNVSTRTQLVGKVMAET